MWFAASSGLDVSEPFADPAEPSSRAKFDDGDEVRQRTARAAQRLSAMGEMTGGIAHDFRNILAVIQSSLNLLETAGGDQAKANACLSAAQEGIQRGLRLTARLLNLARQQEQPPGLVSVNDLLRELETFLKYGAGQDVTIVLDLAPDLPDCLIDPSRFSSAVLNLVVNARDAMPDGGVVEIGTSLAEPGFVRVRVKDNGSGMSPELVSEIFERYFTTKGEFGTGLGVPQVCAFAKRVGGEVRVCSKVGEGTAFDLFIPAEGKAMTLGRQLDRWVNEGGAVGGRMQPPNVRSGPGAQRGI